MADYRVVDAEQLDTDLSSVADAIRTKAGTMESMAFPDGFVNAANGIQDLSGMIDSTITEVVIPNHVTTIREYAFRNCGRLMKITFHEGVTAIGQCCFFGCRLQECVLPRNVKTIGEQMFFTNYYMKKVDGWLTAIIGSQTFNHCQQLTALIIRSDTACTLSSSAAFNGATALLNGTGYIYVPSNLVDSYKSATNWSAFANQFRALEDYTVDGTTTGELDETKI